MDLYEAAAKGNIQTIQSTRIPDVDATNTKRETLLYLAAKNGHSEIVRYLLQQGAEPKIRNSKGQTALMAASAEGHVDVMKILCNGSYDAGINLYDCDCRTALHLSANRSSFETWRVLLNLGDKIEVNPVDFFENTPLHLIASNFDESYQHELIFQRQFVESLLEQGADFNRRNRKGLTPLMEASARDKYDIVSILLTPKYKVHINTKDTTGKTALMYAVETKSWTTVELLLSAGADINCRNLRGFTAVHAAVYFSESEQFAEIFMHLKHRQQMRLKKGGYKEICDIVDKRLMKTEEMVTLLTKNRDFNFDTRDFRGRSVTDLQIRSRIVRSRIQDKSDDIDDLDMLKIVILSSRDDQGNTILHRLLLSDFHPIFKPDAVSAGFYLGETVNLVNDRGRTALHCMAMCMTDAHTSLEIKLLLKLGADRSIKDIYGKIPAEYTGGELFPDRVDDQVSVNFATHRHRGWISPVSGSELLTRLFEAKNARFLLTIKGKNLLKVLNVQGYQRNYAYSIWQNGDFASKKSESVTICEDVTNFVLKLLQFVAKREPLFQSRLQMVGSSRENTKIDEPDEFDFSAILVKLGEVCQVVEPSSVVGLPKGYIHLKRISRDKPFNNLPSDYLDNFFSDDGYLLTDEVNSRFQVCIQQVLDDNKFWENEQHFDKQFFYSPNAEEILWRAPLLCETLRVYYASKINESQHVLKKISIDVVPCVHIDNWWPKEAIPCRKSKDLSIGCNFVFDQPQRLYPRVPYSHPYAKISFAPIESEIVADSPFSARAAYMVAKQILDAPKHSYFLKTCLLYCLEAFPEKIESCSEEVTESDLNFWVRKLLKCYLLFCLQDIVPCYFMPEFHTAFYDYRKPNRERLKILGVERGNGLEVLRSVMESLRSTGGYDGFCVKICDVIDKIATAYSVYWSVCDDETEVEFSLPDPEVYEDKHFQRSELLDMIRSTFVMINQKPHNKQGEAVTPSQASATIAARLQSCSK